MAHEGTIPIDIGPNCLRVRGLPCLAIEQVGLKFRIFRSLVTRILVGLPLGHHLDHDSTNFIFSSGYNHSRLY